MKKEELKYKSKEQYEEGVKLKVEKNYLVPILDSGMVVYVGEKENYGDVVIIQQVDGTDVWYSNLGSINVKLYDYVEKGSLIGEVNNDLYMIFSKDGNYLNYEEYIY